MKTVMTLLEAAVREYEQGSVEEADKMLYTAYKLRQEMRKATTLVLSSDAKSSATD